MDGWMNLDEWVMWDIYGLMNKWIMWHIIWMNELYDIKQLICWWEIQILNLFKSKTNWKDVKLHS